MTELLFDQNYDAILYKSILYSILYKKSLSKLFMANNSTGDKTLVSKPEEGGEFSRELYKF